jgi:PII-like signaling protein
MQTQMAKRVEILIEAPMQDRLTEALMRAGARGFTVLPVLGGAGSSGEWSRDGQPGRSGMVAVVCLIRPEALDATLKAAFALVARHIGLVNVADVQVVRPEIT